MQSIGTGFGRWSLRMHTEQTARLRAFFAMAVSGVPRCVQGSPHFVRNCNQLSRAAPFFELDKIGWQSAPSQ